MTEKTTPERIYDAAKTEFLEKGFKSASLRNIVTAAGVTTGAFYGYYSSKENVFCAIVDEQYTALMNTYRAALEKFEKLPPNEQTEHMSEISQGCLHQMLLYAYVHPDEFTLLLTCAEGTRYERFIDEIVELEIEYTHKYQEVLRKLGIPSPHIDPQLEHIITTGMFNAYFELIIHKMPLDRAEKYLDEMSAFYQAGWLKIMGQ